MCVERDQHGHEIAYKRELHIVHKPRLLNSKQERLQTGRLFDPIIAYDCDEKGQVATINLKEVNSCQSIYHFSAYLPPTLLHGTLINQEHN